MDRLLLAFIGFALPCTASGQVFNCVEQSDCITISTVISDDSINTLEPAGGPVIDNRNCRIIITKLCAAWWKWPSHSNPNVGDTIYLKYSLIHSDQKPVVGKTYFVPIQVLSKYDYYFSGGKFDLFVADSVLAP